MKRKISWYGFIVLVILLSVTACGSSAEGSVKTAGEAVSWTESLDRYSDKEDISTVYQEAVIRMTDQGILQGYDDGAFYPEVTLTREQGAKIVTYLLLGPRQAEALSCEKSPYGDVEADRWSAACIAWCTENHILDGYGDGNFGPADDLTGRQFAKMLLCAYELGDASRYLGDVWKENVSADAGEAGLFAGDESMDSDSPLQRQQAALMADNARTVKEKKTDGDQSGSSTGSGGSQSGDIETSPVDIPAADNTESEDSSSGTADVPENTDDSGSAESGDHSGSTGNNSSGENIKTNENGDILLPDVP